MNEGKGFVARVFRAVPKSGAKLELLRKFETSSAELVKGKQGIVGYRIYEPIEDSLPSREVIFESLWRDIAAVKAAFGSAWQASYLPEGYVDLIDNCSVAHYHIHSFEVEASGRDEI